MSENNIIYNCNDFDKIKTKINEESEFHKRSIYYLYQFFLQHGPCFEGTKESGALNESYSRHIIEQNNTIFFVKTEENKKSQIEIPKIIVEVIAKKTPLISFAQLEMFINLYNHYIHSVRLPKNEEKSIYTNINNKQIGINNTSSNTSSNSLNNSSLYNKAKSMLFGTNSELNQIMNKIYLIKRISKKLDQRKIKILLLFVLFYKPNSSISENVSKLLGSYLNTYIENNSFDSLSDSLINNFFYVYNDTHLLKNVKYVIESDYIHYFSDDEQLCILRKIATKSNHCTLQTFNLFNNSINTNRSKVDLSIIELCRFIRSKGSNRTFRVSLVKNKNGNSNKINEDLSSIIIRDGLQNSSKIYEFKYSFINKISKLTSFVSLNQLNTLQTVYEMIYYLNYEENIKNINEDLLFESILLLLLYIYSNHEFKTKIKRTVSSVFGILTQTLLNNKNIKFQNLSGKSKPMSMLKRIFVKNSENQNNTILLDSIKISLELSIQQNKQNQLFTNYNEFMSSEQILEKSEILNKIKSNIQYIHNIIKNRNSIANIKRRIKEKNIVSI